MRPVGWTPLGTATFWEEIRQTIGFHALACELERRACGWCQGTRTVYEQVPGIGLVPVLCEGCAPR